MAKALKKPNKKVNGYKMPDPLPKGEVLADVNKKTWRLGASIGKGGFGEIYSAQDASKSSPKYPFVVKVEPHGNGPLFVEMHFYMKNAKPADVEAFMKKHKLKTFGMPLYLGSGSHEFKSAKFRFIVMEKFGPDVDKLRAGGSGALTAATVFQISWQITYVLEYIHDLGYVHADIKGGNVLLGATPETQNQAYLLDFGLATKFTTNKEFKPNPKKAHDGTIEYLSRDAHQGVQTRRGDLEILGYNILHWLGGSLPWDSKLGDPNAVQQLKEDSMADIPKFVKTCLKKNQDTVVKFLQYVANLRFNEKPDYKKIRTLFEQEVKKNGANVNGPLEFTRKRRSGGDVDGPEKNAEDAPDELKKRVKKKDRKIESEDEDETGEVMNEAMKEVLAKKNDNNKSEEKKKKRNIEKTQDKEEILTEAMKQVLVRKKERDATRKKKPANREVNGEERFKGYNAEMVEIAKKITSPKREQETGGRSRRNVPILNYDERTQKALRNK